MRTQLIVTVKLMSYVYTVKLMSYIYRHVCMHGWIQYVFGGI